MQFALGSVQFTIYNVQCDECSEVLCAICHGIAMCSDDSVLCSVQCAQMTLQCAMCRDDTAVCNVQ